MGLDQLGRRGVDSTALIGAVGGMAYFGVRADSVQDDWHASTARLAASRLCLCRVLGGLCGTRQMP